MDPAKPRFLLVDLIVFAKAADKNLIIVSQTLIELHANR
jgi:hypothetical protein